MISTHLQSTKDLVRFMVLTENLKTTWAGSSLALSAGAGGKEG
jgi:hypothetical protein